MNTLQVAHQDDSKYNWAQKLRKFLADFVTWTDPTQPDLRVNPTRV